MTEQSEAAQENVGAGDDARPAPQVDAPSSGGEGAADGVRVAILAGGLSHERDVSLRSGRRVAAALRDRGLRVEVLDVDANLLPALERIRPDVVWPLVHGSTGEDGSLQDLLALLGLPFVGTAAAGCRLASRKPVAKAVLRAAGLPTPDYAALPQSLFREVGAQSVLRAVEDRLGLPLVVKPAGGGSALGVTVVTESSQLPGAMVACFAYGDEALIERRVAGTEVAVSVVDLGDGPRALPAVEIVTDGPYDYDARYNPGRSEYFVPARLDEARTRTVGDLAVAVHRTLGLRHLSRTDMILDDEGTAWFLDINVAPGMTETSLFPQAAQADGPLDDLYVDIVRAALRG
ncbi:D-alanine--D-alanine ligase family protein [Georgenia thermotolerans]|uniref:D-alanine--D-alanine ligase n=1 Tax=Georgenia thermotolerans TaxID=527326 RepID=A0A7J5UMT9_9MICO|nr:D-alanine--D-alanine ligase [Georgenia thermotolerans]KAE8763561.1 D-alanine--D-alanine ligase [Georgenia thermotolerans]